MEMERLDLEAASEAGIEVHLKHPGTGELLTAEIGGVEVPTKIKVFGKDSKRWADATKAIKAQYKGQKVDADELDEVMVKVMIACTRSWSGFLYEGKELPCNPESVEMIFSKPGFMWLVEQLMAAAGDRRNLFLTENGD